MSTSPVFAIAQFALAFYERAVPLNLAGMDLLKEYTAHKKRVEALANANVAPTEDDYGAMNASLTPLENSLRDSRRGTGE